MAREIPLTPGLAHQAFSVELGDYTIAFTFDWLTRFEYFRVKIRDVTEQNELVLSACSAAHVGVNLFRDYPQYGSVYIEGDIPTVENIGIYSKLMWEAPSDA